ncbi:MAG: methyl-accepting chemotaxis protein [Syntrophomonadaceae bacterium]|nr:methyl-accepting chemotaxis protein [Syntrophomonadaceae bacterium]MDH7496956.1 methyl-accepting chemotaxis protein [Syntrophomonadaceae bacterium]
MKLKLKVGPRLVAVFVAVIVLVTGGMGYYGVTAMKTKIIASAQEKLQSDMRMGMALLDQQYPGPWAIGEDGRLYKGNALMEDNSALVDRIGALTGDTVTIFKGDTRVSTNVKVDGVRKTGTKAAPEVVQRVLHEGQPFLGEADVVGTRNLTSYEPIRNPAGKVIGMFYVGVPATPYDRMAAALATTMLWYALAGILVACVAAMLLANSVSRPLGIIEESIRLAAEGDLTGKADIGSRDEIGSVAASLNAMRERMAALIGRVQQLTERVSGAAGDLRQRSEASASLMQQMSAKAGEMATNAQAQADLAERTRQVIDEMSAGIQQVASNAHEVSVASAQAAATAEEGGVRVERAVAQMGVISDTVNCTAGIVQGLGEKSQAIGEIVDVITGIAEQTNLLALNAAIEAARAGEQGRGFAVVAEEVRKLAEESGEAAKEIAGLIKEIQYEAGRAVQAMQEGTRETDNGIQVVAGAGQAFRDIITAVRSITDQTREVSAASQQMAASTETALEAVNRTAASGAATLAAAQEMSRLAEHQLRGLRQVDAAVQELAASVSDIERALERFRV